MNDFIKLAGTTILLSSAIAITGCSSDDDSSSGVSVPKNAIVLDATNAEAIATEALTTTEILLSKGSETTVTAGGIINQTLDQIRTARKNSGVDLTTGPSFSETYSCADFSIVAEGTLNSITESGTYTDNTDGSGSESGSITYVSCEIITGFVLNGKLNYKSSWKSDASYTDSANGSFTMTTSGLTIALNSISFKETGSDYFDGGTGAFVTTVLQYVYDPSTGGGFAVKTTSDIIGNELNCGPTAGVVEILGDNKTRVSITFNSDQSITIAVDTGSGTFTPVTTTLCTI